MKDIDSILSEAMNTELEKFIIVGDRVLIKPKKTSSKTDSGLFLPPGVKEREKTQSGYVLKIGPGYAVGTPDPDEEWKQANSEAKYIPLQAQEGDLAVYLQSASYQIEFNKEKYIIVPHAAILMLIRDEDLFT